MKSLIAAEVNTLAPSDEKFTGTPHREKYCLRASITCMESSLLSLKILSQLLYLSARARYVASTVKKSPTMCEKGKNGWVGVDGGRAGLDGDLRTHPLHCSL